MTRQATLSRPASCEQASNGEQASYGDQRKHFECFARAVGAPFGFEGRHSGLGAPYELGGVVVQVWCCHSGLGPPFGLGAAIRVCGRHSGLVQPCGLGGAIRAVSYTHLTLPTKRIV